MEAQHISHDATRPSVEKNDAKREILRKYISPGSRVYPTFLLPGGDRGALDPSILPAARKVHQKGFKLLCSTSPLERRMNSYFRLPPQPPRHLHEEHHRLMLMVKRDIMAPRGVLQKEGLLLDGFMLLETCKATDPLEVADVTINDSNLVGAVATDLAYFSHLVFLDVGENKLHLNDFIHLTALEELHLHCNEISDLHLMSDDGTNSLFPCLHTLNVSFNSIPSSHLHFLGLLQRIQRLDISFNNLKVLLLDLSFLSNVRQLALENNKLNSPDAFHSLASLPNLTEVHLNFNQFMTVPLLQLGAFPMLEVLGLAVNQVTYFEDVAALKVLSSPFRRIVLWGNPLEQRCKDVEMVRLEYEPRDIQVVLEGPVPPRRRLHEFYVENVSNFVRVAPTSEDLKLPKSNMDMAAARRETATTGPSFFVTQVHDDDKPEQKPISECRRSESAPHASARPAQETTTKPTPDGDFLGKSAQCKGRNTPTMIHDSFQPEFLFSKRRAVDDTSPIPLVTGGLTAPKPTVRGAIAELQRMLRQPLPPIRFPHFASNKKTYRK